jgi:hypothetical protein
LRSDQLRNGHRQRLHLYFDHPFASPRISHGAGSGIGG